ncbi:hypothetical protein HAX54_043199 [Datura stramonium]|uniref:Uncharacterized protein n=1 Tax=Datura stramonium TaxID=4076 RepID=A0ABS8W2I1_DATST|nr:hypothetical protein [Datura stramonium]
MVATVRGERRGAAAGGGGVKEKETKEMRGRSAVAGSGGATDLGLAVARKKWRKQTRQGRKGRCGGCRFTGDGQRWWR